MSTQPIDKGDEMLVLALLLAWLVVSVVLAMAVGACMSPNLAVRPPAPLLFRAATPYFVEHVHSADDQRIAA
jgi:hypothetical protein